MPSVANNVVALGDNTQVDLTVTGSTKVWTIDTQDFRPFNITFIVTALSGLVTTAVISFGTNSPSYDNLVPLAVVPSVLGVDDINAISLLAPVDEVLASSDVYLKVTTAAVATTFKIEPSLVGFYG